MSYILDALKKLEHEKARKKGNAGMTSISGELFRPEKTRQTRFDSRIIIISAVLVLILVSAVVWYLLRGDSSSKPSGSAAVPVAKTLVPSPPATPPVPPAPLTPAPAAPTVSPAPAVTPSTAAAPQVSSQGGARGEPSADLSMPVPADIKVSGIAWQDERAARRAVINGFLLKEGSVVNGAKITEILPEKVRFSMSGRTFEITMQSSGLTGAGR
jgi:general secretion pathway protein B